MAQLNKSYVFQVEITYSLPFSKLSALDFSSFPTVRQIKPHELSENQRQEYLASKINLNKQSARLVSDCENSIICDHIDNLIFLIIFFSAKIIRVKNCISFTTYPFLRDYCIGMADKRADSPSKIQKSFAKLMTNSLAGNKRKHIK